MLKYTALLFNTVALLICQFFFVEEVKVTQNVPSSAKPDSEFIVELTITKGAMGGFAKLQQFIPQGLTAVPVEMKGGDFKFVDQQVKIIWMSLPSDPEFKISYKVKVGSGIGGDKKIGGKFSYVVDNVKQEIQIAEATVSIQSNAKEETPAQPLATTDATPPAVVTTPIETKIEEKAPEPVAEVKTVSVVTTPAKGTAPPPTVVETKTETPTPATETKATTTAATQDASGVVCTRKTPDRIIYSKTNATNDFVIDIKINKGNVSGFAKLLETLPAGFTAAAMESAGGTFTFVDQKVKYVWVSVPTQTEFSISYKVTVPDGVSGNINIDGVFSYIENDETKKAAITTSTIAIDNGGGAAIASTPKETPAEVVKAPETPVEQPKETPAEAAKASEPPANTEAALSATPAAQGNVTYRVQIAALKNAIASSSLASRYNISQSVVTEMAEGYTKYTIGAHSEYKSARDAREEIKNKGVVGPFVTAYNTGKRITVQEALMITSQKWYK